MVVIAVVAVFLGFCMFEVPAVVPSVVMMVRAA